LSELCSTSVITVPRWPGMRRSWRTGRIVLWQSVQNVVAGCGHQRVSTTALCALSVSTPQVPRTVCSDTYRSIRETVSLVEVTQKM